MESDNPTTDALRHLERAEAAPYVDYPPTPRWYTPAVGLWSAAVVVLLATSPPAPLAIVAVLVLVGLEFAFFAWYRRYHGAMPSLRSGAPAEIRRVYQQYAVGIVLVLAAIIAATVVGGPVVGGVVTVVLVTGGLSLYEVVYGRAAEAVKARLA